MHEKSTPQDYMFALVNTIRNIRNAEVSTKKYKFMHQWADYLRTNLTPSEILHCEFLANQPPSQERS